MDRRLSGRPQTLMYWISRTILLRYEVKAHVEIPVNLHDQAIRRSGTHSNKKIHLLAQKRFCGLWTGRERKGHHPQQNRRWDWRCCLFPSAAPKETPLCFYFLFLGCWSIYFMYQFVIIVRSLSKRCCWRIIIFCFWRWYQNFDTCHMFFFCCLVDIRFCFVFVFVFVFVWRR